MQPSISEPPATLHGLFRAQTIRSPDALALDASTGALSYQQLDARSDAFASALTTRGVGPGSIVALSLPRSPEQMIALLALLKAGAACLPLDPAYPHELLAYMLADSEAAMLITQQSLRERLPETSTPLYLIDAPHANERSANNGRQSPSLCYVIYTSGSTGRPKGVAMPHRALVNLAAWHRQAIPLHPGERVLQFTTLSFDVAFQEIFTTWAEGGTLVLMDEALRRDPGALWRFLAEQKIARFFLPYVALQQLAEQRTLEHSALQLREVITAGEQLRITPQIRRLFSALPGCRLHNHYGPSETHVVTAYTLPKEPADWMPLPPIGCAISRTVVELLGEDRAPVPRGEIGELHAGGDCLADGYLGRPEQTAERFVLVRGERLYRTGDQARQLPDGNFEFLGRADTQIKLRGFRIEPAEIELQLAEHRSVRECAVVARAQRLIAYWVGETVAAAELRAFLTGKIAPQLVPSEFVQLAAMPLTPSGKIDRRSLPDPPHAQGRMASRAPTGDLETKIAGVWREVLGVAQVGAEDNFFDLGGTSLTIVTAQRLLNSELRRDLDVTTLFQFPTISTLARHLRADLAPGLSERSQTRAQLQRAALARRRAPQA